MNMYRKIEEMRMLVKSMLPDISNGPKVQGVAFDFTTLYKKLQLWLRTGAKTFRLSKELVDAFSFTDVPLDVMPADFHYPFEVFIIEGEKPLYQVDIRGEQRDVYSLLFVDKKAVNVHKEDRFLTREGKFQQGIDWDISISGMTSGLDGYGLDHMWVNMRMNETVKDACQLYKQASDLRGAVSMSEAQKVANIFFNTIMYINDSTRVPIETESIGRTRYKLHGKKQKINSEYIHLRPPKHYIPIPRIGKGRTIDKRFIVRGHYRQQVHGKGRLERKRIWILPFWKGPELAEVVSKKYKVE